MVFCFLPATCRVVNQTPLLEKSAARKKFVIIPFAERGTAKRSPQLGSIGLVEFQPRMSGW
jgi:hypothetical protein